MVSPLGFAFALRLDPVVACLVDDSQRTGRRCNTLTTPDQSHHFLLEFDRAPRSCRFLHFRSPCLNLNTQQRIRCSVSARIVVPDVIGLVKKVTVQRHSRQPFDLGTKALARRWHTQNHVATSHGGADADSGLVHTVRGTSGHASDIAEANTLLHGQESVAFGDAGYQGVENRPDATADVTWHVAMRPGKRKALNLENQLGAITNKIEKCKASIRAKVEHPFRVIKRQFGVTKVRYRGLKKNTAQLVTFFALSNLWMVRPQLMGAQA